MLLWWMIIWGLEKINLDGLEGNAIGTISEGSEHFLANVMLTEDLL